MTSDPESQKRYQAWLGKTTDLPPDPYSTDAVERRAVDDIRFVHNTPRPTDDGAGRGRAMLALLGGGAAIFATAVVVAYTYNFVQAHPVVTATGLAAIVAFFYLPRRWKIRSLCAAIALCLATFAVLIINNLIQENALEKVNARQGEFLSAAEPQFRVIASRAVEDGLKRAQLCADCAGEATHEFYPALRRRASLSTRRTTRYSRSIAGHQMNIDLTVGATISLDNIKSSLPIEPTKIAYSKPDLIVEFVFADKTDTYGRAPRFRNFDDLSQPEKNFVKNEIIARSPNALEVIGKCRTGTPSLAKEGNENVLMISDSDTAAGFKSDERVFFKCEMFRSDHSRNPVNTLRFTLRLY